MVNVGDLFAKRFRLLTHAGDGGSASVYRSFDEHSKSLVALKIFNEGSVADSITAEFWHREGTALQKMSHDCVVGLVDIGRCAESGYRFIATEWIDGQTLQEALASGTPLDWLSFMRLYGDRLLDALCHVFERDVAHRDLSPRNVLVAREGHVKLIDFGLAKLSDIGIGQTLQGWKTPPYCPPEDDTGRHTLTRDPFSFCAIAVRALHGKDIADHDALYDALGGLNIEPSVKSALTKALSREPKDRFENVLALRAALGGDGSPVTGAALPAVNIRFVPSGLKLDEASPENIRAAELSITGELNEACSVYILSPTDAQAPSRLGMETASYRLVVDVAQTTGDHLVVISAAAKRISLDGLYKRGSWMPDVLFHLGLPKLQADRERGRAAVEAFYLRAEQELAAITARSEPRGDAFLDQWARVLDAMKERERTRFPPIAFTYVEVQGQRLFVKLDRPSEASVGEYRAISRIRNGRWVFRGQIESIEGTLCCLYSKFPFIAADEIPQSGSLDHDWSREQKALDRQAAALERFRERATPSDRLRKLVLLEQPGNAEPGFGKVPSFFDKNLNQEKKELVSRFIDCQDLLLIHGPPGTGKTKVIVEIVRQELAKRPDSKILLVAQTHVAIDHALRGVVQGDPALQAVRISSGSREMGESVRHCSVEARGDQLTQEVTAAGEKFLRALALQEHINYDELLLGVRAAELLSLRRRVAALTAECDALEADLARLRGNEEDQKASQNTRQHDELRAKQRGLKDDLEQKSDDLSLQQSQLKLAEQVLVRMGKEAKDLAVLPDEDLEEWCNLFLEGHGKQRLRDLIALAEDWRLKFAKSDDFKAAIIARSKVVAGTCVGFSGEAAATMTAYDLCIVDESSKATSTELLLPLSRCGRAVLVGDHYQLPPFVEFALRSEAVMEKFGFSKNLLEAQLFESLQAKLALGHKGKLRLQYRMRGAIGRLVSHCFYDGDLQTDLQDEQEMPFGDLSLTGLRKRVTWYDTHGKATPALEQPRKPGFVNPQEVQSVISLLKRLNLVLTERKQKPLPTIGVISGYADQVEALSREVRRSPELAGLPIECNSVHTFQGREVDICIYSVTRNNPLGDFGFLTDWRHLNVALSRARWYLVIVGSIPFCSTQREENPFKSVVEFVTRDSECEAKECPGG